MNQNNQKITLDHALASDTFREVWELDDAKIANLETQFTYKVKALVNKLSINTNRMDSLYDSGPLLKLVSSMIDDYGELFHMVYQTYLWKKLYDAEDNREDSEVATQTPTA